MRLVEKQLFIGKDAEELNIVSDDNCIVEFHEVHDISGSVVIRFSTDDVITSKTRICNMENCGV